MRDNCHIFSKRPIIAFHLVTLWLSGVVALDLCAADEFPPISLPEAQTELREMEQLMDGHFRHMAGRDALAVANAAISNFNALCQAKGRFFDEWSKKLEEGARELGRQKEAIDRIDAGLSGSAPRKDDGAAVDAYNIRVRQRNEQVKELNARNRGQKTAVEAYNEALQKFKRESESQRDRLENAGKASADRMDEQQTWLENRKDVEFYRRVNGLHARLIRTFGGTATGKGRECIKAAASLREELGEMAAREERERTNGLVVVEALLCGRVKCRMIVDTGASTVTIPPAVASMLGLMNGPGEEVESTLAGGMVIKGRKVILPLVSVQGQEVGGVEAIVIPEMGCGVDGLLGHSYLDHFSYQFDKSRNPPVRLQPRGTVGAEP